MPDPAIDAINAGLPYTEPTDGMYGGGRVKRVKSVTFVANPNDPSAPPRRVIDVDDGFSGGSGVGGGGGGWFGGKKWGKDKVAWDQPTPSWSTPKTTHPMSARPLPTPSGNSHSAAQSLGLGQNGESTNVGSGGMLWHQPLAPYGWDMSWRERRHWRKLEKEQEKLRRDWERDELKRAKSAHKEIERKEKEGIKKKKQEIKTQEKLLKAHRKNPYRSMPDPTPATSTLTTATPTPGAKPTPAAQAQPTKWMMMPTMEEFGVRRPFDARGHPRPGGTEWPMMSRAMTHAVIDMSREERVHAVNVSVTTPSQIVMSTVADTHIEQAGSVLGSGWGGTW